MATPPVLRVVEREARVFARLWRGIAFSLFVTPVLYLVALGLGLGGLVKAHTGKVEGLSYLQYVTPGVLMAVAMQVAAGEAMWPVLGGVKWVKNFHATVATSITADQVLYGYVLWIGLRAMLSAVGVRDRRDVARRDPVGVGGPRDPGRGAVRGGILRAAVGVLGRPRQRRRVPADHADRRAPAVPVLGRVLPDLAAPGVVAEARDDLAAMERHRAGARRDHGHVRGPRSSGTWRCCIACTALGLWWGTGRFERRLTS